MIAASITFRAWSLRSVLALTPVALTQGCALELDTGLGHWAEPDAEAESDRQDGGKDGGKDGGGAECRSNAGDAGPCAPATDAATSELLTVSLGLTTSYFADGKSFPAGQYTLVYEDGCWKSGVVAWTVNLGGEGYWIEGGQPEQHIAMAPGTVGTFAGLGAYGTYEACVAANVGRAGITFAFQGGPLGLKLESLDPLTLFINLMGGESVGGRSPTFRLTCSGPCPEFSVRREKYLTKGGAAAMSKRCRALGRARSPCTTSQFPRSFPSPRIRLLPHGSR
jgi:hypothetical protein